MTSNACTNESIEINVSGFIQMTGNFSITTNIFQKKYSAQIRKAYSLSECSTVRKTSGFTFPFFCFSVFSFRNLAQWQQLILSSLIWRRYQRSRPLVHCSHWMGVELRWPHISHPQTLCPLLLCFVSSHISLLPNPPTRCSPISSLFSAPSSPAS